MMNNSVVSVASWVPGVRPEPAPRPAKWDGRQFPGRCPVDGCDNQALGSISYWTGGGPGAGEFVHKPSHCRDHIGGA